MSACTPKEVVERQTSDGVHFLFDSTLVHGLLPLLRHRLRWGRRWGRSEGARGAVVARRLTSGSDGEEEKTRSGDSSGSAEEDSETVALLVNGRAPAVGAKGDVVCCPV